MSDETVDQIMTRLEKKNQAAGSPFSPDRMREVRQKLEAEKRELSQLAAQQQKQSDAESAQIERRLATPTSGSADERLRRIPADASTSAGGAAPGFQPPAVGERAMDERVESGPEKKDKEIYLAEKRLSRL